MREFIFIYAIPISTVFIGIYFCVKTEILKDQCNCSTKPYSFARAQLLWWTLIISCCFSIYYGLTGNINHLNTSTLVLLGTSLGTTTLGRIIDNTEINNGVLRHQDNQAKKGFLNNILSDNNGVSIHRFQAFVFNLIFGFIFIIEFASSEEHCFIEFNNLELGLMGISSAAYIGLKLNENGTK